MSSGKPIQIANIEEAVKEYEAKRPTYGAFSHKMEGLLVELLRQQEIEFDFVESRTKGVTEFRNKILRPGKEYQDPVNEITDLSGARIVVYYLDDVGRVSELVEREFNVDFENSVDKSQLLKPNEFGYISVHYVVSICQPRESLLEWQAFKDMKAEIQIRTVLQHAWAAISRALDYTQEEDVPSNQRRRLFRLCGVLELADAEFAALSAARKEIAKDSSRRLHAGDTDIEINLTTLREFMAQSDLLMKWTRQAAKIGYIIWAEGGSEDSRLVSLCSDLEITSLTRLQALLQEARGWAPCFLQLLYKDYTSNGKAVWTVWPSFLVILVIIATMRHRLTDEDLVADGWSRESASKVLAAAVETLDAPRQTSH